MKKVLFLIIIVFLFILPSLARAASSAVIDALTAKLERWDVEEIWPEVKEALTKEPKDP
jgi:hypothetical protein